MQSDERHITKLFRKYLLFMENFSWGGTTLLIADLTRFTPVTTESFGMFGF